MLLVGLLWLVGSLPPLASTSAAQPLGTELTVPFGYRLHDHVGETPPRPEQPDPEPAPRPPARPPAYGDPQRVVVMPTAFTLPRGERILNTYELASFEAELGVRDGFQVGVQTVIPIGLLGVGVSAKLGWEWEHVAVAVHAQFLGAWFFVQKAGGAAVGGLGVVMTVGNRDHHLNLGIGGWGGVVARDRGAEPFGALVPHIGGSLRVADHARLQLEAWFPHRPQGRHFFDLAMIFYGVRVFGAAMWADLGLMRVLCEDCEPPLEDSPLGVPYLSLGRPF